MNSDRFSEREREALRAFFAELASGSGADQTEPRPDIPPVYVAFQRLLAAAKNHDGDNISDIHECFSRKKLEPVLPHEPPQRLSRVEYFVRQVQGLLSEENVRIVSAGVSAKAAQDYRRASFRIFRRYVTGISKYLNEKHETVIHGYHSQGQWNFETLMSRDMQVRAAIFRLRIAGIMYASNLGDAQTFAAPALERLRQLAPPFIADQPATA